MRIENPYMYKYKMNDDKNTFLKFETAKKAFYPTETSVLLIEACRSNIRRAGKTLDLGCGIGITGLVLSKIGLCTRPLYASDISKEAIKLVKINAKQLRVEVVIKCGSLFEPWMKEKFDIIVDDVSGISDAVAKITPWFPMGVTCEAGVDGTKWVIKILEDAPFRLKRSGKFFFPILSLSNEKKILNAAKKNFSKVEQLLEKEWFLPKMAIEKIDTILPLIEDGTIECKKKFGAWTWTTKIFMAC